MKQSFDFDAFRAARNAILLSLDVEQFRAYLRIWGKGEPSSDHVCLVAMHKARCKATDIPFDARVTSATWLREHGYTPGVQL